MRTVVAGKSLFIDFSEDVLGPVDGVLARSFQPSPQRSSRRVSEVTASLEMALGVVFADA